MSKRRRTGGNVIRAARRPIDKSLKVTSLTVAGTQVSTELQPAMTFPGTLTGLRWSLSLYNNAGTGDTQIVWAIVVVPQGTTASTLSIANSATLYSPEQNVLTFGYAGSLTSVGAQNNMFEGSTKTMRKLKVGDTMVIIAIAEATNTWNMNGCVQFFLKT